MVREIPQKTIAKVLWNAGHKTPKSMLRRGNIPVRSAKRYIAAFKRGESHERKPYKTRTKSKQNGKVNRKVIEKIQNKKRIYSLRQMGTSANVSHEQARIILKNNGVKYRRYKKRIKSTEKTMNDRLNFAERMEGREDIWPYTFFTDECSFWLHKSKPNKAWGTNEMDIESMGSHGPKIHVWGAISLRGALNLEIFEDNLTSDRYVEILKKKFKKMKELYPEGFVFQQDGSPVHKGALWYTYHNMPQLLDFPGYSPDVSPIENVWGWLKQQVNKDLPKTVEELKKSIKKHWKKVNIEFLEPYIESMPKRIEMLIESEGKKINY